MAICGIVAKAEARATPPEIRVKIRISVNAAFATASGVQPVVQADIPLPDILSRQSDSILKRILDYYPRFYDKRQSSFHYRYHEIISKGYQGLETDAYRVELSRRIIRPLQIWRDQVNDYLFEMKFRVRLNNIRQVTVYINKDAVVRRDFEEGIDEFDYGFSAESETVIPTDKYVLVVLDWNDNMFVKGFPENTLLRDDLYDKDVALDQIGENIGVARRTYRAVEPEDYANTVPPYCNEESEWDYAYEQRMLQHIDDFENYPLIAIELKKYFEIYPSIEGRWRHICKMDVDRQDEKYMATNIRRDVADNDIDDWNAAVFDIRAELDAIPPNLTPTTGDIIESMVERTFPLSKKVFFAYTDESLTSVGCEEIVEDVNYGIIFPEVGFEVSEEYGWGVSGGYLDKHGLEVVENYNLRLISTLLDVDGDMIIPENPRLWVDIIYQNINGDDLFGDVGEEVVIDADGDVIW